MNTNSLPQLNTELENGIFAGLHTKPDGVHCAVILLLEVATNITWKRALDWAKYHQGGELPSRPVAALLFANVKGRLRPSWHWISEEFATASCAWGCDFNYGHQVWGRKTFKGGAVAVRMIPLVEQEAL